MPAKAVPVFTSVAEPRPGLLNRCLAAVNVTARRTDAARARRRTLKRTLAAWIGIGREMLSRPMNLTGGIEFGM